MTIPSISGSKVIVLVTPKEIVAMLCFLDRARLYKLEEVTLLGYWKALTKENKAKVLVEHAHEGVVAPIGHPPYSIVNFPGQAKITISMITQVLGLDKDSEVDENVLGLLVSMCHPDTTSYPLDFPQYLSDAIYHHFINFCSTNAFR